MESVYIKVGVGRGVIGFRFMFGFWRVGVPSFIVIYLCLLVAHEIMSCSGMKRSDSYMSRAMTSPLGLQEDMLCCSAIKHVFSCRGTQLFDYGYDTSPAQSPLQNKQLIRVPTDTSREYIIHARFLAFLAAAGPSHVEQEPFLIHRVVAPLDMMI